VPLFQNESYCKTFRMNESTGEKNIHMNEFTLTFVLILKQKATRKCPIAFEIHQTNCLLFYKAGKQINIVVNGKPVLVL